MHLCCWDSETSCIRLGLAEDATTSQNQLSQLYLFCIVSEHVQKVCLEIMVIQALFRPAKYHTQDTRLWGLCTTFQHSVVDVERQLQTTRSTLQRVTSCTARRQATGLWKTLWSATGREHQQGLTRCPVKQAAPARAHDGGGPRARASFCSKLSPPAEGANIGLLGGSGGGRGTNTCLLYTSPSPRD